MASLTGQLVAETYKALLKLIDNDILTASEKQITDGFGGGSNVFIDSQGFLRANKFKVTNGLATQFLKADGSLDSNAYLTSITGAQVITALGYTPVPTTRTITINGETHNLAADNSWTVGGTAAIWGNITGTLSNQTDLQNALNAKYNNPAGTISQYIRGDGTLATFPTMPGGLPTGGSAGQILAKIDATDYNAQWIDNYATQTKNEVKLGQTLTKGTPVYVSSANGTNMIVSAASNTSEALSSKTLGLLETGGATNDLVKCVTFGLLAGLDTSTASAGDPVWLGPNGTLIYGLVNKPYAPAHLVYIGVVTRVQSNNGEIFVNVQNGFELKEIHDVYIADPANNHGLFYDIADGLWKNKSIASALGYTPQAQLSGTGFVKASGTTITYDNSTYLTTADAASTYQLLTNLSTDLTASATKYPSVNAVIAGLGTKLNLSGGTLTGNLTISSANPKLLLTDTDNNPDYSIQNADGTFKISDETNSADRFLIYSTGIGYYNGDFKANKLYVEGGLSTQFIKADGTLDSNTYLTSASLAGYLATAGGTMTGDLNFYTLKTTRVGGNAYIRGSWQGTYWGIGAAATGHTIIIDQVDFSTGAYESITDVNLMLGTRTVVHSGNVATYALPITGGTVTGSITATSFVKSGGTSSQFLMADGSVTTLSSPVTGSGSAGYIPKWTTAANIGSSNIYDDGTSIGIAYSTPNKGGYGRTLTGAAFGSASFGFEAVGGTTTNGGLVGGLSFILSQNDSSRLVGSAIQSNLVGTTATNYGADLRFYAKADAGVIGEVARMTSAGLRVYGTIIKDGGTSSQYLMADGSVSTGPDLSGYLPLTGGTMTGAITSNVTANYYGFITNNGSGITTPQGAFMSNTYPATADRYYAQFIGNWSSAGTWGMGTRGNGDNTIYFGRTSSGVIDPTDQINLRVGPSLVLHSGNYSSYALPLTGGSLSGQLTFSSQGSKITFGDSTSTSPMMIGEGLVDTFGTDSDFMTMYFRNSFRLFSQLQEVARFTNTGLRVYGSIVKDGGTSAQFLKADGSIDSNTYATTSSLSAYLPLAGGTMTGVINGNGGGNFYMYFYSRIGLPNTGRILYNNGTASNMFFGEIAADVYGFTANLYSDIPTLAMNVSSKRVGIGFASPNAPLDILSQTTDSSNVVRYSYNGTPTGYYLNMGTIVTAGLVKWTYNQVNNGTTYSNVMTFDRGKIGINNTSPAQALDVGGAIKANRLGFLFPSYSGNKQWEFASDPNLGDGAYIYANGTGYAQSWFPNGNIGINTTTDAGYKFDVNGTGRFSGQLTNTSGMLLNVGATGTNANMTYTTFTNGVYSALNSANPSEGVGMWSDNQGNGMVGSLYNNNASSLNLVVRASSSTGGLVALKLSGLGGAATFSSNVTSGGVIQTASGAAGGYKIGSQWVAFNSSNVNYYYTGTTSAVFTNSNGTADLITIAPSGTTTFVSSVNIGGYIDLSGTLYLRGNVNYLNAAGNAWNTFLSRNGERFDGYFTNTYNSGVLDVTGIITAIGGINFASTVRMRWGGNNTPALGFPFGGSDTGNSLFIEAADGDSGGIAINNDGVTVYGAADTGFVFRAIDEDSYQSGVGLAAATTFQVNQGTSGGGSIKGDFTITGSAYANAFYESSDFRLKTLIEHNPIVDGIENLQAKLYTKNGKTELGYFAQDAEKLMPYAVEKGADGFLSLSYREVHTAKIARLEQRVAELEKQLNIN